MPSEVIYAWGWLGPGRAGVMCTGGGGLPRPDHCLFLEMHGSNLRLLPLPLSLGI